MVTYLPVLEILMFHSLNEIYFSILTTLNKFIEVFYQLNPLLFFVFNICTFFILSKKIHDIITNTYSIS